MPGETNTSVATIVTTEYADEKNGGLGTYIEMLVPYLQSRFDALQVVLTAFDNKETFDVREGADGTTIVELPFPQTNYRKDEAAYERYVGRARESLDLDSDGLVVGNDWFGGYVAEKLVDGVASPPTVMWVPHLYRSLMMLYGYEGDNFNELLSKAKYARFGALHQIERRLLQTADLVLFCSAFMQRYTLEQIQIEPSNHAVVEHYTEDAPAVKDRYRDEIRDVLFAGRFIPQKGILDLAEHMGSILECLPEARIHLYGRGGMENVLRWGVRRFSDRVTIHGFVPRETLLQRLAEADLLVMPSIFEPFGYSALEAMAAGVPVAASTAGGLGQLTSWLPDGLRFKREAGTHPMYFSPAKVGTYIPRDEMLRVFRFARSNPDVLEAVGRKGAEIARTRYTRTRYRSEMDAVLDDIGVQRVAA